MGGLDPLENSHPEIRWPVKEVKLEVPTEKKCTRCDAVKPLDEFPKEPKGLYGRRSQCKACRYEAYGHLARDWNKRNREKRRVYSREYHVRRQYGLTLEESEAILARGCAICGGRELLGIDHCHASGQVRDALCRNCNAGLGQFGDDLERIKAAVAYLEKHRQLRLVS